VEIKGESKAKRGKRSGTKQVYVQKNGEHVVLPVSQKGPRGATPLIETYISNGNVVQDSWMQDARKRVAEARRFLKLPG
jgi:nicotinate phosphoribosyltransferase